MLHDCRNCRHMGNDVVDRCRGCWKDGVWKRWEPQECEKDAIRELRELQQFVESAAEAIDTSLGEIMARSIECRDAIRALAESVRSEGKKE